MSSKKIDVGVVMPIISAVSVDTGRSLEIAVPSNKWQLIVVYRGKHCGRCKKYLNSLQTMLPEWENAGFNVIAVSADSREKAQMDVAEFSWTFPLACELAESEMKKLGVYISEPLSPDEADGRFSEPAVFVLRPDGTIQIAALSNGPAARPDLTELLDGMIFTINNDRPVRGTVVL
jgi:peroxiredoxin